tara:strand:+ start:1256 stop:1453 length:198 start_codon:yes stop_codon:yes gene_type:complete
MKEIIKQFFLHGVGNRFFQSAKILYSNLKYLSKNNIQDLEVKKLEDYIDSNFLKSLSKEIILKNH